MTRWLSAGLLLTGLLTLCRPAAAGKKDAEPRPGGKGETIKLFNGQDLRGWEGYMDLFSARDGMIVAKNEKPLDYSTYLLTRQKYRDFRLTLSARLVRSDMHSGVALWGQVLQTPEKKVTDPKAARTEYTYQGHLVMFPAPWGLYDLYRRHSKIQVNTKPSIEAGRQKEWNEIEILAVAPRLRVAINGKQVVDYTERSPELIQAGPIGLQLHSNKVPQEVHFKGLLLETNPEEDRLKTVK